MVKQLPKITKDDAYDSLFTSEEDRLNQEREKIVQLDISDIHEFTGHPFKVRKDENMQKLVDSVKENGILVPTLVRPDKENNGYEMVSGHRRMEAYKLIGLKQIPAIVRDLTDDQATIVMVDSNIQRENILPSERGLAYKMKLDAMKRQGNRTDLTLSQVGTKSKRSDELLAEQVGDSRNQIQRFIRLTYLTQDFKDMVDDTREDAIKIALNPAVEISYLKESEQDWLLISIIINESTPSLSQAQRLKRLSQEGHLNEDVIYSIMTEEKSNQLEKLTFKMEEINEYFPKGYSPRQKSELIINLLKRYAKQHAKQEQER